MLNSNEYLSILTRKRVSPLIIERELSKKNVTLYSRGMKDKIGQIIDIFREHGFSDEEIFSTTSVLVRGIPSEIEGIFDVFNSKIKEGRVSEEILHKCMYIFVQGKASEVMKIFEVLDEFSISSEAINACPYIFASGKAKRMREIFIRLTAFEISQKSIEKCMSVVALGKIKKIENIIDIFYGLNVTPSMVEKCLSVFVSSNPKEIELIINYLIENGISLNSIGNCLSLFAKGNLVEIMVRFETLTGEPFLISTSSIDKCLSVLFKGSFSDIEKNYQRFLDSGVSKDFIESHLGALVNEEYLNKTINMINDVKYDDFMQKIEEYTDRVYEAKCIIPILKIYGFSANYVFQNLDSIIDLGVDSIISYFDQANGLGLPWEEVINGFEELIGDHNSPSSKSKKL